MIRFKSPIPLITLGLFLGFSQTMAKAACPEAVLGAVEKAYTGPKVFSCLKEKEKGVVQFEVKLKTKSGNKLEIDVSPEGSIKLVEESVALDSIPQPVLSAFNAKYSKVRIKACVRQTKAEGSLTYEIAFKNRGKNHEVTLKEDGTYVEVE